MQGYKVKLPCKRRRPRDVFISRSVCSGNKSGQYRRRYIRYLMRYRSWPSVLHCRPVNQFSLEKWSARTRHSRLSHGISSYWELKYHRVAFRCNTLVPQLSKDKLIIRTSGDHAFFASHTFLHEFTLVGQLVCVGLLTIWRTLQQLLESVAMCKLLSAPKNRHSHWPASVYMVRNLLALTINVAYWINERGGGVGIGHSSSFLTTFWWFI